MKLCIVLEEKYLEEKHVMPYVISAILFCFSVLMVSMGLTEFDIWHHWAIIYMMIGVFFCSGIFFGFALNYSIQLLKKK